MGLVEVEVRVTRDIDMPRDGEPDPGERTVLHQRALMFELIDHRSE